MSKKHRVYFNLLGIFLFLPVCFFFLQAKFLTHETIQIQTGDALTGTIYPGELSAGVILLEGFGSDQVNLTSLLVEFQKAGFNVLTFDFSGHGRSEGTLGFDNAQTDAQAKQLIIAMEKFKTITGLEDSQLVLLGHSLGARVALQTAGMVSNPPAGLILLGTQVNLSTNAQSEFFTGTSDTDLDWVQNLGPTQPATNIILLSGTWDDILTPKAATQLAEKLAGRPHIMGELSGSIEKNTLRIYQIFPRVLHNYEVFDPAMIETSVQWSQQLTQTVTPSYQQQFASFRIGAWLLGCLGLFILVITNSTLIPNPIDVTAFLQIQNQQKFLWWKLLLWLPALPVGALIASFFFLVPAGFPAFNMIYVAFLGGYGTLLLVLYWRGWMPGTGGKLPFTDQIIPFSRKRAVWAILAAFILLLLTAIYARSGWFFVYPIKTRLIWLVLFTPVTTIGFWIGQHEVRMLNRSSGVTRFHKIALHMIGLFPFFLWAALLAALGSLSGLTGAVQGLIILSFVILSGEVFQNLGQQPWLTALLQSVLLYWLILPQGVLFGM